MRVEMDIKKRRLQNFRVIELIKDCQALHIWKSVKVVIYETLQLEMENCQSWFEKASTLEQMGQEKATTNDVWPKTDHENFNSIRKHRFLKANDYCYCSSLFFQPRF